MKMAIKIKGPLLKSRRLRQFMRRFRLKAMARVTTVLQNRPIPSRIRPYTAPISMANRAIRKAVTTCQDKPKTRHSRPTVYRR